MFSRFYSARPLDFFLGRVYSAFRFLDGICINVLILIFPSLFAALNKLFYEGLGKADYDVSRGICDVAKAVCAVAKAVCDVANAICDDANAV